MATLHNTSSTRPITPIQHKMPKPLYLSPPRITSSTFAPGSTPNAGILSPVNQNGSFAFDRVIKGGKVNRRVKKKGAFKASWKPAYLVLRPNLLSVYKDDKETELKLSVTLSDVTAVAPVKKSRSDHVFGVFTPSKNYHFAGFNARDTTDWISTLRLETSTDVQEILEPPNAEYGRDAQGYDTTDASDGDGPGSPQAPRWTLKPTNTRAETQTQNEARRVSGLQVYSANEQMTTSQSDFSDFGSASASAPGRSSFLSSSIPIPNTPLSPIPDDIAPPVRPPFARGLSNMSDAGIPTSQTMPKLPRTPQTQSSDPSRVIKQGHLKISKTTSGVRQWRGCWVVLRSSTLSIYKSQSEYSPSLIIQTYTIIEAAEIDRKRENCFQVIGEEKTYRFQAESEDELEMWLGAFKSVLFRLSGGRSRDASISLSRDLVSQQFPSGVKDRPTSRDVGGMISGMRDVSLGSTLSFSQTQQQQHSISGSTSRLPGVMSSAAHVDP